MQGGRADWWDALVEGVVLLSGDRVVDLNEAAAKLLDVDRDRARGAPAIAVLRDHRLEAMWRAGVGRELELRSRTVLVSVTPAGLVFEDRTELRAEQRGARELLGVLSHELRTPLTAIRGVIDALEPGPDGATPTAADRERDQRFLARARAEGERLTRLLDDLTVESRPPRERSVVVRASLARAAALLQPTLERSAVTLSVAAEDLVAWVDEDKFLQVIINLIENAALHGPAGGRVEVAVWAAGAGGRLEVRDGGQPLEPSLVPALFEPHTQGGPKNKGTGLGLYVVKSIAERWGGEVWGGPYRPTDGAPAAGNAFGASFPLAKSA